MPYGKWTKTWSRGQQQVALDHWSGKVSKMQHSVHLRIWVYHTHELHTHEIILLIPSNAMEKKLQQSNEWKLNWKPMKSKLRLPRPKVRVDWTGLDPGGSRIRPLFGHSFDSMQVTPTQSSYVTFTCGMLISAMLLLRGTTSWPGLRNN